jgi:hypothetical protein
MNLKWTLPSTVVLSLVPAAQIHVAVVPVRGVNLREASAKPSAFSSRMRSSATVKSWSRRRVRPGGDTMALAAAHLAHVLILRQPTPEKERITS